MKTISETIKKLPTDATREIASLLKLKNSTAKEIISSLSTITGMYLLLSNLSFDELRFLQTIYSEGDGSTFGEIEKKLNLDISAVEQISNNLTKKLLIYTIKNRQLLTNKLDKVYGISEISVMINITDISEIKEHLNQLYISLKENKKNSTLLKSLKNEKTLKLLLFMAQSGGIINLDDARSKIPQKSFDTALASLKEKSFIDIIHNISTKFNTYIILNKNIMPLLVNLISSEKPQKKIHVHNRYYLILNLLKAFDAISTFGLFLTKQMKFRKIDKKRIVESLFKLKNIYGEPEPPDKIAQLSLYFLNRLRCLKLHKDISNVTLKNIKEEIEHPRKLMVKLLQLLESSDPGHEQFSSPIELPSYESVITVITILWELKETSFTYLETTALTGLLTESIKKSVEKTLNAKVNEISTYNSTINFLCYTGIIEIKNGYVMLSDIGIDFVIYELEIAPEQEPPKSERSIYINPDFTLIIPEEKLNSNAHYHLLTHTEIIKDDIILHGMISKESIIKAYKRGISLDGFMEILKQYSKNEIPQNLAFLLTEWSNQTTKLTISHEILLKASNPSFIDEILYNKNDNIILERISPNYAIINKKYLDEIIKFAQKNDAVISLFEDSEEN